MNEPELLCMTATAFAADGALDVEVSVRHCERLMEAGVHVVVGSPGSGEGHSLDDDELRRLYAGVVGARRTGMRVLANLPESRHAEEAIRRAGPALASGVDAVQLYPPAPGHSLVPTAREQEAYYREVVEALDGSVGLSVNALASGYVPSVSLVARIADDYPQVSFVSVMHPPTSYLSELVDAVPGLPFYVATEMLPEGLTLGARGSISAHANVVPYLCRSIGARFAAGDTGGCGESLRTLLRLKDAVADFLMPGNVTAWNPRWIKAALRHQHPGESWAMRAPYLTASDDEVADLMARLEADGFLARERECQQSLAPASTDEMGG